MCWKKIPFFETYKTEFSIFYHFIFMNKRNCWHFFFCLCGLWMCWLEERAEHQALAKRIVVHYKELIVRTGDMKRWKCSMHVRNMCMHYTHFQSITIFLWVHSGLKMIFLEMQKNCICMSGWIAWYLSCLGHGDSWQVSIDQSWQPHVTHFDSGIIAVLQLLSKGCERLSECALAFLNTLFAMEGHMVRLFAHPECQSPRADICWVLVPGYTHFPAKHCEFMKIFLANSFAATGIGTECHFVWEPIFLTFDFYFQMCSTLKIWHTVGYGLNITCKLNELLVCFCEMC